MSDARKAAETDPLEPLARTICRNMGLDPDEEVPTDVLGPLTAKERRNFGNAIPALCLYVPRWQLFRANADEARAVGDLRTGGRPAEGAAVDAVDPLAR